VNAILPDVAAVREPARAAALLSHPLRTRILALAASPASATELAARLGLPRQQVNYHVRRLAEARFLRRAGRVRKRNLVEQRYAATARAYVDDPAALGPIAAGRAAPEDALSAARLVALAGRAQADVVRVVEAAAAAGVRVATMSLDAELRFESAAQRQAFASALQTAITDVIGRYASPARFDSGEAAPGRPFRLVVGCYPAPPEPDPQQQERP
jgi:DNA-binding transcriptional ArsR family regulator